LSSDCGAASNTSRSISAYATVAEAKAGIGAWLDFYNEERQHQSLGYRTPAANLPGRPVDMWTIGVADRLRPRFPRQLGTRKMLAFAHIPTGTATNNGFDINDVNSKLVQPAVASAAIGADVETGGVTT
jgi:Integrase core domain